MIKRLFVFSLALIFVAGSEGSLAQQMEATKSSRVDNFFGKFYADFSLNHNNEVYYYGADETSQNPYLFSTLKIGTSIFEGQGYAQSEFRHAKRPGPLY